MLLAGFALGALLLAAVGIYGVISYSVNRRRNEIGIRMALGADAGDVRNMVLRQGMRPVTAGLVLGIAAALALGRLLQALLFEMRASNPIRGFGSKHWPLNITLHPTTEMKSDCAHYATRSCPRPPKRH